MISTQENNCISDFSTCIVVVIQSLSCVQLFATLWNAARQASLSFTISGSLLKLMSNVLMMPPNHLILSCLITLKFCCIFNSGIAANPFYDSRLHMSSKGCTKAMTLLLPHAIPAVCPGLDSPGNPCANRKWLMKPCLVWKTQYICHLTFNRMWYLIHNPLPVQLGIDILFGMVVRNVTKLREVFLPEHFSRELGCFTRNSYCIIFVKCPFCPLMIRFRAK